MNYYIVCPVRLGESPKAKEYVEFLEGEGHTVFYPPRDVKQDDNIGYGIISAERDAIMRADYIAVFYDARSQGIHFDLGMAYALDKPIEFVEMLNLIDRDYPDLKKKSYPTALHEYMRRKGNKEEEKKKQDFLDFVQREKKNESK